ncbi:MAG: hypothetical protein MGG37_02310 [Trichodesmium sp. MAG_R01]|nr:hypothetical protein [Trichodesmium sp. MAG_R01]
MKNQILMLAYISVAVKIFGGMLIVFLLWIFRQGKVINSLVTPQGLFGLTCTVKITFNTNSRGKVNLNIKESSLELIART